MSHGRTSLNKSSFITTELPDILKNLLNVLQQEVEVSNEFLVEIEINVKKRETKKDNYYDVDVTDKPIKNKKKNKKHKKTRKDYSKLSKKKYKKYQSKKNQNTTENSNCYTLCKTLRTRSKGKNTDDYINDSDDRYPDESFENLPSLNESQRQLLRALRREQTEKYSKKENLKHKNHIAVPWNPDEDYNGSSYLSKSNLISKTSSFSRHYPYVPRINRKKNKKAKIRVTEHVDFEEKNNEKDISKNVSSKKKKGKKKNKNERGNYANVTDVLEEEDDNVKEIPMRNENISEDMYKIFK
ncbi:Hypothetical protein SRAE_2000384300 [Strongyloides ratti]|uniref:Uncharacterized protein n=1 Tax=Strongyloides ratti TaxID=34506 RepID=A0A090LM30_STRRB|nr:Hypothetical protein SRAE_2000384300 [Strongyloides ratti]CEF69193.1 Hypothetical protein SRAE_2000384300 [Strongyloides ratti]